MLDPGALRPKLRDDSELVVQQAKVPSPEFSRFLYTSVGGPWYWCDRLPWTYEQWLAYLNRPELETWVAYVSGTPAGYIELEAQTDGSVKIVYFGLLPQFIGQGIGGHLLSVGIKQAWEAGANRVWVHTCSLDGPHAYKNYEARGLRLYDTQINVRDLSTPPPGPWPGAAAFIG
jgi:ribosomal protein S18 acetylase RimI-like enzyme